MQLNATVYICAYNLDASIKRNSILVIRVRIHTKLRYFAGSVNFTDSSHAEEKAKDVYPFYQQVVQSHDQAE